MSAKGDLYVTDARGRIVEITANGATRTLAGSTPGFHDGVGGEARFRNPSGIAVAPVGRYPDQGQLIVADAGNALVRLVGARDADGVQTAGIAVDRAEVRRGSLRTAAAAVADRAAGRTARDRGHARRGARQPGLGAFSRGHRRAHRRRDAGARGARRHRDGSDRDRRLRLAQRMAADRRRELHPHSRGARTRQRAVRSGTLRRDLRCHDGEDRRASG